MTNIHMAKMIIEKEPELFNISQFLKIINYVGRMKILRLLRSTSYNYTDLMTEYGVMSRTQGSGKFAYHLRKMRQTGLIELNKEKRMYSLTFRGTKAVELLDTVEKITNLSMSSPENAMTKITANLNKNESWLRPLIQKEIRNAMKEMYR